MLCIPQNLLSGNYWKISMYGSNPLKRVGTFCFYSHLSHCFYTVQSRAPVFSLCEVNIRAVAQPICKDFLLTQLRHLRAGRSHYARSRVFYLRVHSWPWVVLFKCWPYFLDAPHESQQREGSINRSLNVGQLWTSTTTETGFYWLRLNVTLC